MRLKLLGNKIGYSLSPKIYGYYGEKYQTEDLSPEELDGFFNRRDFDGINITKPYKEVCLKYLDGIDETARKIGAVNTVVNKGGKLFGYNTDVLGIIDTFKYFHVKVKGQKVLILGDGGAGKSVKFAVEKLGGIPIVIRRVNGDYIESAKIYQDCDIIVNASLFGTDKNPNAPLDINAFKNLKAVIDVNYSPAYSKFYRDARAQKIKAVNGLKMLTAQAGYSYYYFSGKKVADEYIRLKEETENVVLIGLPTSGKSTVGKLLAKSLGKEFIDTDTEIEKEYGDVSDLIKNVGETEFRRIESVAVEKLKGKRNKVIATGGGAVESEKNREILSSLGIVIKLEREIDKNGISSRPVLESKGIEKLKAEREPLYEKIAVFKVDNNGKIQDTVNRIKKYYETHLHKRG